VMVLHEWTHDGKPYRFTEGEDFNPAAPEYIVETPKIGGRWEPCGAFVLEEGQLIAELLQARAKATGQQPAGGEEG
jgi:hypothetical protein